VAVIGNLPANFEMTCGVAAAAAGAGSALGESK